MSKRTMAALIGAVVIVALCLPSISGARSKRTAKVARLACSGDPHHIHSFSLTIPARQQTTGLHDRPGTVATGIYALPSRRPKGLVVFAHGHNNTPEQAWEKH